MNRTAVATQPTAPTGGEEPAVGVDGGTNADVSTANRVEPLGDTTATAPGNDSGSGGEADDRGTLGNRSAAPTAAPEGGLSHPSHMMITMNRTAVADQPTAPTGGEEPAAGSESIGGGESAAGGAESVGSGESDGGGEALRGRMLGLVGSLVFPPSEAADVAELEECLETAEKVRACLDAYVADVVSEGQRRGAADQAGAVNTAAWLRRHTGMSYYESRSRTRTSDGLDDVPAIRQALAEGRLTHGHAKALTRLTSPEGVDMTVDADLDFPSWERTVADAAREHLEMLIVAAGTMTVDPYQRFLNRFADRAAGDDGAGRDRRHLRNRRVTTSETHDGMGILRAVLPPAQFAVIENEMRRLAEAAWRAEHPDADGISAKELTCPQRNADALLTMAHRSRELADGRREPLGNHIDVMLLVDAQTLDEGLHPESRCELDDGRHITPTTARRLLCDANILTALWDKTKFKLDLGYDARCANRNIRRALIARDRTCTAPGCDRPHWMCQIHHKVPWSAGGPTNLDNLTLLCHKHHHLHHTNERKNPQPGPNGTGRAAQNGADPPADAARAPTTGQPAPPKPNGAGSPAHNGAGPARNGAGPAPNGSSAPPAGRTAPPGPNGARRTVHDGTEPPANGTRPAQAGRPAPPGPNGTAAPPGNAANESSAGRPAPPAQNGTQRTAPNGADPPGNGVYPPRNGAYPPGSGRPPPPGSIETGRARTNGASTPRADRSAPSDPNGYRGAARNGAAPTGDGAAVPRAGRPTPGDPESSADPSPPKESTSRPSDGWHRKPPDSQEREAANGARPARRQSRHKEGVDPALPS